MLPKIMWPTFYSYDGNVILTEELHIAQYYLSLYKFMTVDN